MSRPASFTGEYGWPRYAEYRHALVAHQGDLTNAARLRAASEFSQKLITVVARPQTGNLPTQKSFVSLSPDNAHFLAFRKKHGRGFEFRVVEVEGREASATLDLALPVTGASETDLLGNKVADVSHDGSRLKFKTQPWKVHNFDLS